MAVLLPLPDDPRIAELIDGGLAGLPTFAEWPRSLWLRVFEDVLREFYPQSSSRDRKLTARHYAPFPLRDGHDVP